MKNRFLLFLWLNCCNLALGQEYPVSSWNELAQAIRSSKSNSQKAKIHLQLADTLRMYDWGKAGFHLAQAEKLISGTEGTTSLKAQLLAAQAQRKVDHKQVDKAPSLFEKALEVATANKLDFLACRIRLGWATYLLDAELLDKADTLILGCLNLAPRLKPLEKAQMFMLAGRLHYLQRAISEAKTYLQKADSLSALLGEEKLQLETAFHLAYCEYYANNSDTSLAQADSLAALARQKGDWPLWAKINNLRSFLHQNNGRYSEALSVHYQNIAHFRQWHNRLAEAEELLLATNAHRLLGSYDSTIFYGKQTQALAEKVGDRLLAANSVRLVGVIYSENKEYAQAIEQYRQAAGIFESLNDPDGLNKANNSIGVAYIRWEKYDSAYQYVQKSYGFSKNGSLMDRVIPAHNMGSVLERWGKPQEAIPYYQESLGLALKVDKLGMQIRNYNRLATTYLQMGDNSKALFWIQKSLAVVMGTEYQRMKRDTQKIAADVYAANKEFELAFEAYQLHKALHDSIFNAESDQRFAQVETQLKTKEKEKENALLKKELDFKETDLKNQRLINWLVGLLFLVSFGGAALIWRNLNKLKASKQEIEQQKEEIDQQNDQLQEVNQHLAEANQDKNRLFQIIAHDLRGPIGSFKGVAELIPFYLEMEDLKGLDALSKEIGVSMGQISGLLDNLLNWSLDETGRIAPQIKTVTINHQIDHVLQSVKQQAQAKQIDVAFSAEESYSATTDPEIFKLILRNLVSNAIKFTPENSAVNIRLEATENTLNVLVQDTGTGIPPEKAERLFSGNRNLSTKGTKGEKGTGLGLVLVKKFASLIGGDVKLQQTSSAGSIFCIAIPKELQKTGS